MVLLYLTSPGLLPGPLATSLLKKRGAKVIKVEFGSGDWLKNCTPLVGETSAYYASLNHGKEILTFDLRRPESKDKIYELIRTSDVVIDQFRPGVLNEIGFGFDVCKSINTDVIYLALTGYGQLSEKSNRPGHDLNYLAESGVLSMLSDNLGKPIMPGFQLADVAAGSFMLMTACLAGLYHRGKTETSYYEDISIVDNLMPLLTFSQALKKAGGDPYEKGLLNGNQVNYNVYQTFDGGWVALGALELKFWNKFCDLVGNGHWKRSMLEELSTEQFNPRLLEQLFKSKTQLYWKNFSEENEVCLSVVEKI